MTTIPHRELRNNSSEILRRVAAGESFEITNNGVVTAVLCPPPGQTELERLRAAGQVRPAKGRISIDPSRRLTGVASRDILDDLRGDR